MERYSSPTAAPGAATSKIQSDSSSAAAAATATATAASKQSIASSEAAPQGDAIARRYRRVHIYLGNNE
jgi:hypothetical protein